MSYIKEFVHKKRIIKPLGIGDAIGLYIVKLVIMFLIGLLVALCFIPQSAQSFIISIVGYPILIIILLKYYSKYDYNNEFITKTNINFKLYGAVFLFFLGYWIINYFTIIQIANMFTNTENFKKFHNALSISNPLLLLITISIIAPIFEETIYRGIILEGLLKKYNYKIAIFFSALIFSIAHGNIPQSINAFFSGLFIGYLYHKTHSLKLCIFAHILNNSLGIILAACMYFIPFLNGPLGLVLGLLMLLSSCVLFLKGNPKYVNKTESA